MRKKHMDARSCAAQCRIRDFELLNFAWWVPGTHARSLAVAHWQPRVFPSGARVPTALGTAPPALPGMGMRNPCMPCTLSRAYTYVHGPIRRISKSASKVYVRKYSVRRGSQGQPQASAPCDILLVPGVRTAAARAQSASDEAGPPTFPVVADTFSEVRACARTQRGNLTRRRRQKQTHRAQTRPFTDHFARREPAQVPIGDMDEEIPRLSVFSSGSSDGGYVGQRRPTVRRVQRRGTRRGAGTGDRGADTVCDDEMPKPCRA